MYGLRLLIKFSDKNGKLYYTNILERDYSGASVVRDVTGQPLSFQYGDGTVDDHLHVIGTVANIAFYTETPFELSDLYTADKRKYKVVTRTDDPDTGTIIFQGWLTPQQYSEQIAYKADVELSAVCGLGELGDIDYLQADGTAYTGIKSYKQILVDILSKLELDIDIHIAVDFRATGVTGDPLAGQDIDVSIYEGLSCDDVLKQILPECRIMQRENGWWIESFNNLSRASFTAYHYDYTGAAKATASSTITPGKNIDYDVLTVYEGVYDRMNALDKVVITQDYGKRDNLITNGDFTNGSTGWTPAGVTIDLRKYDDDKYYAYLRGGTQDVSDPDTLSHYITQTLYGLKATNGNKANLKFQYGLMGTDGHSAPMYIMLKLWGTTNTYYGTFVINPDGETYHIEFRTEAQIAPYPYITLQLGGTPAGYKNIDAKPYDEVADNLQSFDFDIDSLPEDGNLQIYLFAARTGDAAIAGPVYTDAKWNFKDGNGDDLPAEVEVTGYNAEKYIDVKDDVKLYQGTLPDYTNAGTQYKGGILKSATSGDLAASFGVDGSGLTYGYTELIARLMISRRNYPNFVFNGTIEGYMHPGEVLTDVRYPSAKLVFNGVTWDVANNEWQGAWVEVIAFESTATVNSNERVTNDSGTSVRASGPTKTRVFSNASTGTPVRITDLYTLAELDDDYYFEVDRSGLSESMKVSASILKAYAQNGVWNKTELTYTDGYLSVSGVKTKAGDSDKLGGFLPSYYTDIVARLGYTPVNKAGDTMQGSLNLASHDLIFQGTAPGDLVWLDGNGVETNRLYRGVNSLLYRTNGGTSYNLWHEGNDGSGSGLDADLLDGKHASDFIAQPIYIPASQDLNNLTTPGMYYCPANVTVATLSNCPTTLAFSLLVEKHAGYKQTLSEYPGSSSNVYVYTRNYYSGTWGAWTKVWDGRTANNSWSNWTQNNSISYGYTGSPSYVSGFTGNGWRIDSAGNAEFDNLSVRKRMTIHELMIDKIRSGNGSYWFSGGTKITRVTPIDSTYTKIDFDSDIGNPFQPGDIVRCQVWTGSGIKFYEVRLSSTSTTPYWTSSSCYIVNASYDGNSSYDLPEVGDEIVRVGNVTDTSRQGAVYITSEDSNSPYLDIFDGRSSITSQNGSVKARLGKLSGITSPVWGSLSGYGIYTTKGYFENVKVSGEVRAGSGTIAGWSINSNQILNTYGASKAGIGMSPFISTQYGFFLGKDDGNCIKAWTDTSGGNNNFELRYSSSTRFFFSASSGTAYIAGWNFDNSRIYNGNIELNNVGTIRHTSNAWRFDTDGSGIIGSGNIIWDTAGNVTLGSGVKIGWSNDPRNLIDWSEWTVSSGSTAHYYMNGNTNENVRIMSTLPSGASGLVWQCVPDASNDADGGWNTAYMSLDHSYAYRYTVWVKRTGSTSNGALYHGTNGVSELGSSDNFNWNPYFISSNPTSLNMVSGEWYLMVGYIHPSGYTGGSVGISGVYDSNGKKIAAGNEFKFMAGQNSHNFRSYLYYCTDTNVRQYFYNPMLHKIDGSEPSISDLVGLSGDMVTTITNNTLSTTNVLANNLQVKSGNISGMLSASQIYTNQIISLGNVTAGSFNIGSGKFVVDSSGNLTATSATITGTINSSNGQIASFKFNGSQMWTGTGPFYTGVTIGNQQSSSGGYIDIRGSSTSENLLYLQTGRIQHQNGEFLADDVTVRGTLNVWNPLSLSKGYTMPMISVGSSQTLSSSYRIFYSASGSSAITLYAPAISAFQIGESFTVIHRDTFDTYVKTNDGSTINGISTSSAWPSLKSRGDSVTLVKQSSSNWAILHLRGAY